ncbi:MAG: DUF937 domain-containing protein [Pirellulales bacterium]
MNIVDLISSQLTPDVLGKLAGLAGASESQTRSATTAAVPALLDVFAKLAGTGSGADQLAKAMGGLDLTSLGNLAGLLGGSQASGLGKVGGDLLGSLLGGSGSGSMLSGLVGTIASFAGIQPGIMKTLLTYLAPIVLGMIAKQFTGRPDPAGVARLFSEQAGNIRGALPKGLSLADLGARSGHSPEPQPAGLPGWLLPLLALAALAVGWYLWNQSEAKKAVETVVTQATEKTGPVTETVTDIVETKGKEVVETVIDSFAIDPKFLEAGKAATDLFSGLAKTLGAVTDEASAKAAVPELEKFGPLLTTLREESGKLPADEKPAFAAIIGKYLGTLTAVIDKVMAIPGVKDLLGPVVTPMIEELGKLSK